VAADLKAELTGILEELSRETPDPRISPEQLLPLVYDGLRRLARSQLRRERADHTLQPTELVHEAYERLADQTRVNWRGRTHFFAVAAQVMRRLLVDHARQRGRRKRGGGAQRITLGGLADRAGPDLGLEELVALDRALKKLAELDEREARGVELRYFAGLTTEEIANVLGVSERTVRNDWAFARAWLKRELSEEAGA
jgi:RNA polymerase sigma-70 factor (ECF subfamily)